MLWPDRYHYMTPKDRDPKGDDPKIFES